MNLRTIIATATTAAVLATGGVALAGASEQSTATPTSPTTSAPAPAAATERLGPHVAVRRMRLRRLIRRGARDVITKTIGIDRATLRTELSAGRTIAQIATAHHVAPQAVIDALVAAAKTKIDAAVTAGKLTSARAARLEARLSTRVTRLVNEWHPKRAQNAD